MMCRRLVMCLASMSAVLVALLASPADANTCSAGYTHCVYGPIGGSLIHQCLKTTTSSVLYVMTLSPVPGPLVQGCKTTDDSCLEVKCSVFGTVDLGDGLCDPTILDNQCGIQGVAYCKNKAGNADKAQGQPFTLDTPLTQSGFFLPSDCPKPGKCRKTLELEAALQDEICINHNWQFETFTPSVFNGDCCLCEYGFDDKGTCCKTRERDVGAEGEAICKEVGEDYCNPQRCTVDLSNYKPGDTVPYSCCLLKDLTPEGVCPQ